MNLSFQLETKDFYELKTEPPPWMVKKSTESKFSKISFHRRIYRLKALKQAAAVFKNAADICVESGNPYHMVTISSPSHDSDHEWLKEFAGSFINHALFFTLEQRRK